MAVALHDAAPRERFVRGDHAGLPRGFGERAELVDEQPSSAIVSADTLLHTRMRSVPSACITSNLRLIRSRLRASWAALTLEVAKRLEQHDVEAEIGGHAPDVGRRSIEVDEVVFEDFDAVEACGLDGGEFLGERAGQ